MVDILVILAHPDDAELCCAGTLLSSIEDGLKGVKFISAVVESGLGGSKWLKF